MTKIKTETSKVSFAKANETFEVFFPQQGAARKHNQLAKKK
jgi:hypothetical protein